MRAPAPIRRTVRNVTRRRFEERFPGKLPGQGIRTAPSLASNLPRWNAGQANIF